MVRREYVIICVVIYVIIYVIIYVVRYISFLYYRDSINDVINNGYKATPRY